MKRLMIFSCAAFVATIAAAQPVLAQPAQPLSPQHHDVRHDKRQVQKDRRHVRQDRRALRHDVNRHHWVRGERIRDHYHGRTYVVSDWRHRHLRRPPHGYHWVRDDNGNLLLVAITTGIITDLLLNSH